MGEVAALGSAFDSEFHKALNTLPEIHACPVHEHDGHLNHHRQSQRIAELVGYYGSKLPPFASVQRILHCAEHLVQRHEYKLAKDACYAHVRSLALHEQSEVQRMDSQQRLSYHFQACMGIEVCEGALIAQADPQMKHPSSLAEAVACLHRLQAVTAAVLPMEGLYWLTLNGTVHMYNQAKRLLSAGFVQQALPFVVFSTRAMETHVIFSTARYLPWRTQLYTTLCNAYVDIKVGH